LKFALHNWKEKAKQEKSERGLDLWNLFKLLSCSLRHMYKYYTCKKGLVVNQALSQCSDYLSLYHFHYRDKVSP